MKRYWFEFEGDELPFGIKLGCGVTAYNYDDAIGLIAVKVFRNNPFPEIKEMVEDIDISTLDADHILPNMSPSNLRGIWFPLGYA